MILKELELKIRPPNEFNDPFEFTPHAICSNPKGAAAWLVTSPEFEAVRKRGDAQALAKHFEEHSDQIVAAVPKELLNRISKKLGVLCLSKTRSSILMWGHYATDHQGIVIGFDDSHEIFHPKGEFGLNPVDYVQERVIYDGAWDQSGPEIKDWQKRMMFSKNKEWEYEQEVRQLLKLASLMTKPDTPGYFLQIPPKAIVEVALGWRCSSDTEQKVRAALQQPSLAHVNICYADLHDTKFEMTFAPHRIAG